MLLKNGTIDKSLLESEIILKDSKTYYNLKNKLNEYYKDKYVPIDDLITDESIKNNAEKLKTIQIGEFDVYVNLQLNTTIPTEFMGLKWSIPDSLLEGECCEIKKPYSYKIKITEQDSILVSTKYYSSSKNPIYIKNDKTFYLKSNSGLNLIDFTFDENIPKGVIKIIKEYRNTKFVNKTIVDLQSYIVTENVGIIKKEK